VSKIIISYRRLDSQDIAMRIRDAMAPRFGKDSVFIDIDSIPLGVDFLEYMNSQLGACDALIAIIGPRWIEAGRGPGQGVHLKTDFVRIEVEAALKRKIPVIPALVGGMRMPRSDELPDALRPFVLRNATAIDSGVNFKHDVDRLIRSLNKTLARKKTQEKRKTQEKSIIQKKGEIEEKSQLATQEICQIGPSQLGEIKREQDVLPPRSDDCKRGLSRLLQF